MRAENRRRFISTVILWVLFNLGFTWNIIDGVALWSSVDLRLGRLDCEWTSLAFDHFKTHPKSCSFNSATLVSFKILFHPTYFSENKKFCVIMQKDPAQPWQSVPCWRWVMAADQPLGGQCSYWHFRWGVIWSKMQVILWENLPSDDS